MSSSKWGLIAGASQGVSALGMAMFEDAKMRTLEELRNKTLQASDARRSQMQLESDTRNTAARQAELDKQIQANADLADKQHGYKKEELRIGYGYDVDVATIKASAAERRALARAAFDKRDALLTAGNPADDPAVMQAEKEGYEFLTGIPMSKEDKPPVTWEEFQARREEIRADLDKGFGGLFSDPPPEEVDKRTVESYLLEGRKLPEEFMTRFQAPQVTEDEVDKAAAAMSDAPVTGEESPPPAPAPTTAPPSIFPAAEAATTTPPAPTPRGKEPNPLSKLDENLRNSKGWATFGDTIGQGVNSLTGLLGNAMSASGNATENNVAAEVEGYMTEMENNGRLSAQAKERLSYISRLRPGLVDEKVRAAAQWLLQQAG